MKNMVLLFLATTCIFISSAQSQTEQKIRVLAAPGVNQADPKDWHNTLAISGDTLTVSCPKCSPIQSIAVPKSNVAALRYGQNAYHHWVSGVVTGVFSLGIGTIIGAMPHHQHYFSIDTKDGKALGIQADKSNYRQIAGMLENFAALPIQVTAKDAHFLSGFNTKIVAAAEK
ncbi:MAG TPA: hypothetical protein VFQ00_12175 [Terriglobales bacterium]|nr:hypothetical protein [Terriglobales bacterium]